MRHGFAIKMPLRLAFNKLCYVLAVNGSGQHPSKLSNHIFILCLTKLM